MKELSVGVIGNGGREAAFIQALLTDTSVTTIFMFGHNYGFVRDPHVVPTGIKTEDKEGIVRCCQALKVDLVVSGPELPAINGTNDALRDCGIPVFGASSQAIRIESDKAWAREFMDGIGLPQPYFEIHKEVDTAKEAARSNEALRVVKAFGPCEGKGVIICDSLSETLEAIDSILGKKIFGQAGSTIILEEKLGRNDPTAREISVMYFTGGKEGIQMPLVRDYKREFDGDRGKNTGGIGSHTVPEALTGREQSEVLNTIALPLLAELANNGNPFIGILYVSLMKTANGIFIIEINGRGGDPETIVQLAGISHPNLAQFMLACARGELTSVNPPTWDDKEYLDLVLCAEEYPGGKSYGQFITGVDEAKELAHTVFHAGTGLKDGHLITNGGRVLHIVGSGSTLPEAKNQAYEAASKILFDGKKPKHRSDIGDK